MLSRRSLVLVLVFATGVTLGFVFAKGSLSLRADAHLFQEELAGSTAQNVRALSTSDTHSGWPFGSEAENSTTEADISSMLFSAARDTDQHRRRYKLFEIASNLNAKDAASAMNFAESLSPADRDSIQPIILARWLDLDPSAALQWVGTMPSSRHRNFLLKETFAALGTKNPELALKFLDSLKESSPATVNSYRQEIFQSWAQRNPRAAAQFALKLGLQFDQGMALGSCVRMWAKQEPNSAMDWIRQLPPGEQRRFAFQAVLNEWAIEDPASAANEALSLTDDRERNGALTNVIIGACFKDPKLGRELTAKLTSGSAQNEAMGTVLGTLVGQDPEAAREYFDTLPLKRQSMYAYAFASDFAKRDIKAALEWATQLATDELQRKTVPAVLQRWAETEPQAAFNYASSVSAKFPELLPRVLSTWAAKDPQTAISQAEALNDSKARESALSQCIGILARTAPLDAIGEASKLSGESRRSTLSGVATTWARTEPEAAANWLLQAAAPDLLSAIPNVIGAWTRESPTQAAEWLQQLPPGKTRDSAISSFVQTVRETTPESAAEWALVIGDNQLRENAVRDLVLDWQNYDRNAAMNWLRQASGISEQARQNLLQQSNRQ